MRLKIKLIKTFRLIPAAEKAGRDVFTTIIKSTFAIFINYEIINSEYQYLLD